MLDAATIGGVIDAGRLQFSQARQGPLTVQVEGYGDSDGSLTCRTTPGD